jgi:two-component system, OmpR family, sensor histidine kinase SenX3
MRVRFRPPLFAVGAALFALIALLAVLQYKWLGQISDAERERMRATLTARAADFASDFDRELTRAYFVFQLEPMQDGESVARRIAERYDSWQATARYPAMVKEVFVVGRGGRQPELQKFNPATKFIEPTEWPSALQPLQDQIAAAPPSDGRGSVMVRTMPSVSWEDVPALVVPTPVLIFNRAPSTDLTLTPRLTFTVLLLDREFITREMLPALARQHFRGTGDGFDYQLAVVRTPQPDVVFRSTDAFAPGADTKADASADLFLVRPQEFGALGAEVRRYTTLFTAAAGGTHAIATLRKQVGGAETAPKGRGTGAQGTFVFRETSPLSIVVEQKGITPDQRTAFATGAAVAKASTQSAARWRLLVKHPAGSLETAVNAARLRNLGISSGILTILAASMGLLVLSTRRAQRLARQQMEFVAAVSHELRTPLAVIRSAADNLADGVIDDAAQIQKYGELVRGEGRRLTEMVEQILELSGIQSGQRGFALRPVPLGPLLHDIVDASRSLIDAAGIDVQFDIPDDLPAVLGDEPALRRALQNLVSNATKYGAQGGWIGITARRHASMVQITVADKGIGIPAAEQARIFEPFYRASAVVAAQIQGAGLGLSLVQRIIEAHGGRVGVESTPGSGSAFTISLPVGDDRPVRDPAVRERRAEAHS